MRKEELLKVSFTIVLALIILHSSRCQIINGNKDHGKVMDAHWSRHLANHVHLFPFHVVFDLHVVYI